MKRMKNAALVLCLFVVLLVIFSSYLRANVVGAFFGALAGTPLLVHVFNRVAPSRRERESERTMTALVANADPMPRPDGASSGTSDGGAKRAGMNREAVAPSSIRGDVGDLCESEPRAFSSERTALAPSADTNS